MMKGFCHPFSSSTTSAFLASAVFVIVCVPLLLLFVIGGSDAMPPKHMEKTPVVVTKYGQLRGVYKPVPGMGVSVATYLGVPYATPPVGPNRFSPTRTLSQWVGVHEASNFGPACPQKLPNIQNQTEALNRMSQAKLNSLKRAIPVLRHQSEDCLYLNVYVPKPSQHNTRYPVLVFVHGPSYEWGSASLYDGSVLAARGNILVVTINYRLGILGFFNPNIDVSGRATVANYGLMDQLAALHWVQENIEQFGGDPKLVTVMGHGTGAACLNFLVVSPASAELFRRAILMSGSALSSWAWVEQHSHYAVKAAIQLGCEIPEDARRHYEVLLHCLRNKTVDQILKVDLQTPQFKSSIGPSVDGVTIKIDWKQQMAKMGQNDQTPVDLLLGVTETDIFKIFSDTDIRNGFETDNRDRILRTFVTNNYRYHLQEILLAITAEYTDWSRPVQHPMTIRDVTGEALHDAMLVAPAIATAEELSSRSKQTFFYTLDTNHGFFQAEVRSHISSNTAGPKEFKDELSYVFGAPLGAVGPFAPPMNYTRSEINLSEAMIRFWTNFAKEGHPDNGPPDNDRAGGMSSFNKVDSKFRSPPWDPFDKEYKRYLELGTSRGRTRDHFRANRVALWTWLLPNLERVGARYGPDSPFHKLADSHLPETFSGPTRPWGLKLPYTIPPTTTVLPSTSSTPSPKEMYLDPLPPLPPGDVTAPLETPPLPVGTDFPYTTALGVTIAIGCSLLVLNILAFAAIYYRRDLNNQRGAKNMELENSMRGDPPEIVTDSPEGKPLSVHTFKSSSPSHCPTLHSTISGPCDSSEWPPNYSTCCMQEMQEHHRDPQSHNGNSTLRRGNLNTLGRSISLAAHEETPLFPPAEDHQNFSEMRL